MGRVFLVIGAWAALACAGCGGSSSSATPSQVSARAYTRSVCKAFAAWQGNIKTTLAGALSAASTTTQGKAELEAFFKGAVADTQKIVSRLKAAGSPKVKNGQADAQALVTAFENVSAALQHGEAQAQSLPISDAAAFRAAAGTLMSSAQSSFTGAFRGLSGLSSPQLDAAAKATRACTALEAGG